MIEEIIVKPSDRSITKDVVFGHVMKDPEICLELLQSILPQLNLKSVKEVTAQRLIDAGLEEKASDSTLWLKIMKVDCSI